MIEKKSVQLSALIALLVLPGIFTEASAHMNALLHAELPEEAYEQKAMDAEDEIRDLDGEIALFYAANQLLNGGRDSEPPTTFFRTYLSDRPATQEDRYERVRSIIEMQLQLIRTLQEENLRSGPKSIHIALHAQRMTLIQDGKVLSRNTVSSGAPGTPTPTGHFAITRKEWLRISKQETPYRMPFYLAFTKDYGFGMHALPFLGEHPWDDDYWQEAFSHIGIPVSHGCVRLLPEEARMLYDWAEVGTPVTITI